MAAYELKHAGAGKYNIMDGDKKVAGPLSRDEAEASVKAYQAADAQAEPTPAETPVQGSPEGQYQSLQSKPEPQLKAETGLTDVKSDGAIPLRHADGRPLSELERRRAYERRLDNDLVAGQSELMAPFKALVFALYEQDDASRLWQAMEPILKAGPDGFRREIRRNQRMRQQAAGAAAGDDQTAH